MAEGKEEMRKIRINLVEDSETREVRENVALGQSAIVALCSSLVRG